MRLGALLWLVVLPYAARAGIDPGSQPIGCEQADTQVTLTASAHLDPSCTWTRGVEIVASNVVLDCQGARIAAPDRRYGILIIAPTDVALSNIVVRNCHVEGFLNNLHIEREGFMELAEGVEYEHAFSNIVIEDGTFVNSRGVGIFVDGYVTGVTLRRLHVEGSGSAGIYLEAGSRDNVVEHCTIVNNGYRENGPDGQLFEFSGITVWFWGTGREGLAIDGSRDNRIADNHFEGNSAGAIFLYKNCGEFVNVRPNRWWHRRYGADGNVIERNTIVGEDNGVWVASRMGENTLPMDCSDPAYVSGPLDRVVLDYARDNVVRDNVFQNVGYGVRVEDDRTVVADNEFTGDDPAQQAVVVGTRFRTPVLGLPVSGTTVTGNRASIAENGNPYRWIHGHVDTVFADNEALGRPAGFCEGEQPRTNQFIFVVAFELADPENPPTGPPPVIPPPEPLPPCPLSCASGGPLTRTRIAVRRLATPPGDEGLLFKGQVTAPFPLAPPLDPLAVGIGVRIADAAGVPVLDVHVPGGAYDATTGAGWRAVPARRSWIYRNDGMAPPGGIAAIVVKDRSSHVPGLVRFKITGRRGTFPVEPSALPLEAIVILDPPTAETGQCGRATFATPPARCTATANTVRCR